MKYIAKKVLVVEIVETKVRRPLTITVGLPYWSSEHKCAYCEVGWDWLAHDVLRVSPHAFKHGDIDTYSALLSALCIVPVLNLITSKYHFYSLVDNRLSLLFFDDKEALPAPNLAIGALSFTNEETINA